MGQGLEAGNPDITQRWGQSSSRTYVSKMLRSLSDGEFFLKGNHSWRDETSGQNRRRRTFNLNMSTHWYSNPSPPDLVTGPPSRHLR